MSTATKRVDCYYEKWIGVGRILVLLLISAFICNCSRRSIRLDEFKKGTILSPQHFGLRSLTVLYVDPNGRPVDVEWSGYNTLSGDSIDESFEEIILSSGVEVYRVSDRGVGSEEVFVNGKLFTLYRDRAEGHSKELVIRFGSSVTVESEADYSRAWKVYDVDFESLKGATGR
jgi:hypothetical protein